METDLWSALPIATGTRYSKGNRIQVHSNFRNTIKSIPWSRSNRALRSVSVCIVLHLWTSKVGREKRSRESASSKKTSRLESLRRQRLTPMSTSWSVSFPTYIGQWSSSCISVILSSRFQGAQRLVGVKSGYVMPWLSSLACSRRFKAEVLVLSWGYHRKLDSKLLMAFPSLVVKFVDLHIRISPRCNSQDPIPVFHAT